MASAGEFKIEEYPPGAVEYEGERFVWVADKTMPGGTNSILGGARAAPIGSWDATVDQRRVRTDYPGAKLPSVQILGPVDKPFTWTGRWDDRYNFPGYATAEEKRFDAMVRRGNPVRISFKSRVFWGFIGPATFRYFREGRTEYTFTFDPSSREGQDKQQKQTKVDAPERALDDLEILERAMAKAYADKPAWATSGTLIGDVSDALARASTRINDISTALDTRQGILKPIGDAKRLSIQFRALQGDCSNVVTKLVAVRSDVDMGARTAMAVLDFEAWTRSTRTLMRMAMGRSMNAAYAMDRRDTPTAKAMYRPFAGEHIYSIARKADVGWRDIARANRLTRMVMLGTESLVIPEAGST
jgi:hypothetical protein